MRPFLLFMLYFKKCKILLVFFCNKFSRSSFVKMNRNNLNIYSYSYISKNILFFKLYIKNVSRKYCTYKSHIYTYNNSTFFIILILFKLVVAPGHKLMNFHIYALVSRQNAALSSATQRSYLHFFLEM